MEIDFEFGFGFGFDFDFDFDVGDLGEILPSSWRRSAGI